MNVSAVAELIAATRFKIPELPSAYVHRPQLLKVLAQAEALPLVLVSAPAGTGKTSLVAEWVTTSEQPGTTGWISFEDGDAKFWHFVIECLDRLGLRVPGQDGDAVADTSLGKAGLMALAGVIAGAPGRLTIVVDGYEMISLELAREVDFLLQHTLGKLRLIFVGRVDSESSHRALCAYVDGLGTRSVKEVIEKHETDVYDFAHVLDGNADGAVSCRR